MAKAAFTAEGEISSITIKNIEKAGLRQITTIKDIVLTDGQVDRVKEIIESGGAVKITIEAIQGSLLNKPDGKTAASGEKDD